MEVLGPDELSHIFRYLDPRSLVLAGRVCKEWHWISKSNTLWIHHCLKQWSFCKLSAIVPTPDVWYEYYSSRIKIDVKMDKGRPGVDYKVKSIRHHKENILGVIYVSSPMSYVEDLSNGIVPEPVICSWDASCLAAWKVTSGSKLWAIALEVYERRKVFHDEVGRRIYVTCPRGKIAVIDVENGTTLDTLSTNEEDLVITSIEKKRLILPRASKDKSVAKEYIFVGLQNGRCQIWAMHDMTKPKFIFYSFSGVDSIAVSDSGAIATASSTFDEVKLHSIKDFGEHDEDNVNFWLIRTRRPVDGDDDGFIGAFPRILSCNVKGLHWLGKSKEFLFVQTYDRVLMYDPEAKCQLTANYLSSAHQVKSFGDKLFLGGSNGILTVHTYDNTGSHLSERSFSEHTGAIVGIYVDSYRVLTCSTDFGIRVYRWPEEKEDPFSLFSLYHLLGGSLQYNAVGFRGLVCDYGSCVAWTDKVMKCYLFM